MKNANDQNFLNFVGAKQIILRLYLIIKFKFITLYELKHKYYFLIQNTNINQANLNKFKIFIFLKL